MDGRRLRVGLIGLGAIGEVHFEAYRASNLLEVVSLADPDAKRLARHRGNEAIRLYSDHLEMLKSEQLDIACVLTPASLHTPIALDCARSAVPVLCEKPLSISASEARRLIDGFELAGIPFFYGSSYRFLPAVRTARDLVLAGAIGKPILLREQSISGRGPGAQHSYGPIHYPPGMPGGTGMGLVDHGIHLIDIFAWITDSSVAWALGRGNRSGEPLATEYAVLGLANGATGHLLYNDGTWPTVLPGEGAFSWGSGWDYSGYTPPGIWQSEPSMIHVHGTKGALRIHHYGHALFLSDASGIRQIALPPGAAPDHFRAQIDSFALSLRAGVAPATPAQEGLAALRVLEAIYRSHDEGRVQAVES